MIDTCTAHTKDGLRALASTATAPRRVVLLKKCISPPDSPRRTDLALRVQIRYERMVSSALPRISPHDNQYLKAIQILRPHVRRRIFLQGALEPPALSRSSAKTGSSSPCKTSPCRSNKNSDTAISPSERVRRLPVLPARYSRIASLYASIGANITGRTSASTPAAPASTKIRRQLVHHRKTALRLQDAVPQMKIVIQVVIISGME